MDLFSALALTGAKISAPSFSYNDKDTGIGAKCALPENVTIQTLNDDDVLELVVATVSETTIQKRNQARKSTASAKTSGSDLVAALQCARAGTIDGVDMRLKTAPGMDTIRSEVALRLKAHATESEQARRTLRLRAIQEAQLEAELEGDSDIDTFGPRENAESEASVE